MFGTSQYRNGIIRLNCLYHTTSNSLIFSRENSSHLIAVLVRIKVHTLNSIQIYINSYTTLLYIMNSIAVP